MAYSEELIRDMVRQVLLRTLGPNGISDSPVSKSGASTRPPRTSVTEADILAEGRGEKVGFSFLIALVIDGKIKGIPLEVD